MNQRPLVTAVDLTKQYELGPKTVTALSGVSLQVEPGAFTAIMGPSGSGKSTLLHLLGALDKPTSGKVTIDGADLVSLNDEQLTAFRRRKLGFVFQFFNLLPAMNAWENVALPLLLDGRKLADVRERAVELLDRVGLAKRQDHRPAQLSGGEMQRVAIARALAADPVLLLADEPTGNLDSRSGEAVLELLKETAGEGGTTVIMVTHDRRAASIGDQLIVLEDGVVKSA
ncbi:MAG: ABC transporter ATP-binding protein [Actinomycetota bacterium]